MRELRITPPPEKENSEGPDRLFVAFLEEWNDRHADMCLSPEIQEMVERHLTWAKTMGAESIINRLQRTLELTPHNTGRISYIWLQELIRTMEPNESDLYLKNIPREFELAHCTRGLTYRRRNLKP
jgi:hypothetical protein